MIAGTRRRMTLVKNRPFRQRLGFALAGVGEVWRREKSFRTQAVLALIAIAVLVLLRPGLVWTGFVVVAIAMVLALEMVNAAIEYVIDHIHPDVAPEIRRVKDVAAAAVLVASVGAAIVGLLMIVDWLRS
jgi:undecaprenol kinase